MAQRIKGAWHRSWVDGEIRVQLIIQRLDGAPLNAAQVRAALYDLHRFGVPEALRQAREKETREGGES